MLLTPQQTPDLPPIISVDTINFLLKHSEALLRSSPDAVSHMLSQYFLTRTYANILSYDIYMRSLITKVDINSSKRSFPQQAELKEFVWIFSVVTYDSELFLYEKKH